MVGLAKGVQYTLPANSSAGVVVEVTASASTPAGEYTTTVELAGAQGTRSIPITVKVWNAALPDPKNSTFSYTNWFSSANMNEAGFPSFMDAYYDAGSFNDNFFTVMANYAKVMKKQRQNVIYVPTMALLTSDMTIDGAGNYQFTFKNFDRYIETFIRNGSVKALEGGFSTRRTGTSTRPPSRTPGRRAPWWRRFSSRRAAGRRPNGCRWKARRSPGISTS